jgi:hypothetical protein
MSRRRVGTLVAGLAEKQTVRDFVVASGLNWLLVVELFGGKSTVSVVGAPAGTAFTGSTRTLACEALDRLGKRHGDLLRVSCNAPMRVHSIVLSSNAMGTSRCDGRTGYREKDVPTISHASSKGTAGEKR